MVSTIPRQRAALVEAVPELASFARPAVRLHPRQGAPLATHSSAGGPLLWPDQEPWPTCAVEHTQAVVMAPVMQLFRRDIPMGLSLPEWLFPGASDLLQILWCPNEHPETLGPLARMFWRDSAQLVEASPHKPELGQADLADAVPAPCLLHPEVVTEFPPLNYDGDYARERDLLPPLLPADLNDRVSAWVHPDEPDLGEGVPHYWALATAPGWKLGGWADYASYPDRYARCRCGAPTRLVFDAMGAEGLEGWWQPIEPPGFE